MSEIRRGPVDLQSRQPRNECKTYGDFVSFHFQLGVPQNAKIRPTGFEPALAELQSTVLAVRRWVECEWDTTQASGSSVRTATK